MRRIFTLLTLLLSIGIHSIAQDWTYVNSTGTSYILYGMSFPASQSDIGYACGMQYTYNAPGVVVKTTDGGDNWTQVWPTSGTIDGLQGIWFIDNNTGFAGGWNDYFIKTTDGGTTWTQITCGTDVYYYVDVEFWDSSNGVAACYPNDPINDPAIYVTADGGNSWTPATGVNTAEIMGVTYADQNTLYAVGTGGNVFISTDGGHNWSVKVNLGVLLFGVDFANNSFGVVGAEEKMFATNDGGNTWTDYTTGYENFYGCLAQTNGTAYIGGTDENIYKTTDFGATFQMEHNGPGTSSLYRIKQTQDGDLFACGSQGQIITKAAPFTPDFTADNTTVCEGSSVNFTDLSIGSITSWNWTFEGGNPATSSSQNPTVAYNTIGDYDVTLEISNAYTTLSLTMADMIHVIVAPDAPSVPSGAIEMCASYSEQYSTQPVADATSYTWQVDPSDAGIMSGNGITSTFISNNNWSGDYSIKVRANNQCGNSPWSDELLGIVNSNPVIYNLSEGGGFCEGSAGLEVTQNGSDIGVDYELFLDGVSTGTVVPGTGSVISYGYQTNEGVYSVIGSIGTCAENMTGTPWIYLELIPEAGVTPSGLDVVCANSTSDYQTDVIVGADMVIWSLTPSEAGTIIGSGQNISVEWSAAYSGMVYLSTQGENDCGVGEASVPLEITVNEIPMPEISGKTLVCNDEETIYEVADHAGSSYLWTVVGGEIISGSGTYMINVKWGVAGDGSVEVTETTADNCAGNSEVFNITIDECTGIDQNMNEAFLIYPNPVANQLNVELLIEQGDRYSLTIYNLMGQSLKVYQGVGIGHKETVNVNTDQFHDGQYMLIIETKSGIQIREKFVIAK
jgi:photosystem II stability/assembly factor-like uncharacterized protein